MNTSINIDEIKRFPTVTNPIKADDLHTPQAYAYTLRRAIVTDCNDRQRAALVELLEGKDTAEGVTFNNTQLNRDRLHIWQNQESRRERAAILGEGWQYSGGLNDGTPHAKPGDEITFSVDVKNTGNVAGSEPVLLFISDMVATLTPDVKRLRGFEKVSLQPGESTTVSMTVKANDLAFVDNDGDWLLEEGDFRAAIGDQHITFRCNATKRLLNHSLRICSGFRILVFFLV